MIKIRRIPSLLSYTSSNNTQGVSYLNKVYAIIEIINCFRVISQVLKYFGFLSFYFHIDCECNSSI